MRLRIILLCTPLLLLGARDAAAQAACPPGYALDATGTSCVAAGPVAPTLEVRRSSLRGFYTWLLGIIFLTSGSTVAVAGLLLSVAMEDSGPALAAAGCIVLTAGLVQTIVGGVLLRRDRRRRLSGQASLRLAPPAGGPIGLSEALF